MGTRLGNGFFRYLDITPMVKRIVAVTFGVWFVQIAFGLARIGAFEDWFALDPGTVLWRPWQLATYMFLHSSPLHGAGFWPWHIILNMVMLVFFGPEVERALGSRRFLTYYLVCGITGALLTLLPPFRAITVGASGAVLGVVAAFGMLFPDRPILLFFLPVAAKYVVLVMALMQVVSLLSLHAGISYVAHVGGMAAGYVMLRGAPALGRMSRRWEARSRAREDARRTEVRRRMDEILDKMNREGRESLSQKDWRTLLDESKRMRNP